MRPAQVCNERAKSTSYSKKGLFIYINFFKSQVADLARSLQPCAGGPNLCNQMGDLVGGILRPAQVYKERAKSTSYFKKGLFI